MGTTGTAIKRRGILAAAAAVVAGIAAKGTSQPVAALASTADYFVANGTATFGVDTASGTFTHGVYGAGNGTGVYGYSLSGIGVRGNSSSNHGLYAYTDAPAGSGKAGVYGAGHGAGTFGVLGEGFYGAGTGVQGQNSQYGVVGKVANVADTVAVYGKNESATGSNNIGVYGLSNTGYGVLGVSQAGGVYSGITGAVYTAGGAAFAGGATQATAYAAYFSGKVSIDGPLYVNGVQKFTLKHTDGTSRLLTGALTVEPIVEDFGRGQLASGAASVALDADFRDVADTSDYSVFLTEYGDSNGLYVATQSATGFTVRERGGGAGGVAFRYRVVAKPREAGGKVARLAAYEAPNIKIPGVNELPPSPPDAPATEKPRDAPPAPPNAAPPPRPAAPAATAAPPAISAPAAPASAPTSVPPGTAAPPAANPAPPPRP